MICMSQPMLTDPPRNCAARMLRYVALGTALIPQRTLDRRFVRELMLVAILLLWPLTLLAQEGNQDYYAFRSEGNAVSLFHNVQNHHLEPGRAEAAKGRYGAALEHYEFILRYYPNHPHALASLTDLCQKWKARACDAEGWIKKGIDRNPKAPQTYLLHGMYLHKEKRLKEAVKAYHRAIELAPDSVNAHYNLGLAYVELKEYDLANRHAVQSYQLGAFLPGLRVRLEKAGKWNPNEGLPITEAKPADPVTPPLEKKPD